MEILIPVELLIPMEILIKIEFLISRRKGNFGNEWESHGIKKFQIGSSGIQINTFNFKLN